MKENVRRLHKYSYLWVGCGYGFSDVQKNTDNILMGDISYLEIKKDDKTIFYLTLKRKQKIKVFDESNNGNHLLKFQEDWY